MRFSQEGEDLSRYWRLGGCTKVSMVAGLILVEPFRPGSRDAVVASGQRRVCGSSSMLWANGRFLSAKPPAKSLVSSVSFRPLTMYGGRK